MSDTNTQSEVGRMKVGADQLPDELFSTFASTAVKGMDDLVLNHEQQVKFLSMAFKKMYVQGGEDALLAALAVLNRRQREEEGNADSQEQTSPEGQKVRVH